MKPPLRQPPPKPRPSWWIAPEVQQSREQWSQRAAIEAERMNAVSTTQHVQRRKGDR